MTNHNIAFRNVVDEIAAGVAVDGNVDLYDLVAAVIEEAGIIADDADFNMCDIRQMSDILKEHFKIKPSLHGYKVK